MVLMVMMMVMMMIMVMVMVKMVTAMFKGVSGKRRPDDRGTG